MKVPHTFPVPPLNKGTLNSLKIMEPSPEHSAEQGTFGRSLVKFIDVFVMIKQFETEVDWNKLEMHIYMYSIV